MDLQPSTVGLKGRSCCSCGIGRPQLLLGFDNLAQEILGVWPKRKKKIIMKLMNFRAPSEPESSPFSAGLVQRGGHRT